MKLNKKYFLAIFTALGIQAILGINLANAATFNSVCERNDKKIERILMEAGNRYYPLYDLISIEMSKLSIKLFESCATNDKKSAKTAQNAKKQISEFSSYCDDTCNKWIGWDSGSDEAVSTQKFYDLLKREVEKAISDPNYSSELGKIRGEQGSNSKSNTSQMNNNQESQCDNLLSNIENAQIKFNKSQAGSNSQAVTPGLQMIMWTTQQTIKTLQSSNCPKNAINNDLINQNQSAFNQAQTTCKQINSESECIPKIPALFMDEYNSISLTPYKNSNEGGSSSNIDSNAGERQSPSQQVAKYASQNLSVYDSKYQGKGKKHNPDAEASRCMRFDPKRKQIFNDCDYSVEALFCAINPDPNSTTHAFEMAPYFDCDSNSTGMWSVSSKSALMGRFSAESVALFACKKPSYPGAKFNRDSKSFSGRCSEY